MRVLQTSATVCHHRGEWAALLLLPSLLNAPLLQLGMQLVSVVPEWPAVSKEGVVHK